MIWMRKSRQNRFFSSATSKYFNREKIKAKEKLRTERISRLKVVKNTRNYLQLYLPKWIFCLLDQLKQNRNFRIFSLLNGKNFTIHERAFRHCEKKMRKNWKRGEVFRLNKHSWNIFFLVSIHQMMRELTPRTRKAQRAYESHPTMTPWICGGLLCRSRGDKKKVWRRETMWKYFENIRNSQNI